jgi:hypothetical protein
MRSAAPSSGSDVPSLEGAALVWAGLTPMFFFLFEPVLEATFGAAIRAGPSRILSPSPVTQKLLIAGMLTALLLPFALFGIACLRQPRRRLAAEVALAFAAAPVPALLLFGCVLRVVDLERVAWGPRTLLSPTAGAAGLALAVAWGALLAWRLRRPVEA